MKEENPEIIFENEGRLYTYSLTPELDSAARDLAGKIVHYSARRGLLEEHVEHDRQAISEIMKLGANLRIALKEEVSKGRSTPDQILLIAQHAILSHIKNCHFQDGHYATQIFYTIVTSAFPSLADPFDTKERPKERIDLSYLDGHEPEMSININSFSFISNSKVRKAAGELVNFICDVKGSKEALEKMGWAKAIQEEERLREELRDSLTIANRRKLSENFIDENEALISKAGDIVISDSVRSLGKETDFKIGMGRRSS